MRNKKYKPNKFGTFEVGHNLTAMPFMSWEVPNLWLVIMTKSRELVKEMRAQMIEETSDDAILVPIQQNMFVLADDAYQAVEEGVKAYYRNKVKNVPKPKEGELTHEREEKGVVQS